MREFRLSWLGEAVKIMVQRPDWTRCSVITEDLLVALWAARKIRPDRGRQAHPKAASAIYRSATASFSAVSTSH